MSMNVRREAISSHKAIEDGIQELIDENLFTCPDCGISFEELEKYWKHEYYAVSVGAKRVCNHCSYNYYVE